MIGEERGEERGEETDPFIVDVPGEVGSRPAGGQTAVDGGGVPQVVPPPAAGYQRTSRAGSLHHQEVGVLRVCGKDRSGSTHLTPEPPRGLPADREERHRGPGGARQVHGDPGHRVDRLGLRLVQNKTKRKFSVGLASSGRSTSPVELLPILVPADAVELVRVSVATVQDSPGSRHQISGHLNTLNHGRAHSHRR